MIIPKQLQDKDLNFVLLEKESKKPFQQSWQKKLIKYDDKELLEHLRSNGNYGVIGGGEKNLIVIDFDSQKLQDELLPKLPKTFTIKTGRGLFHLYYFSDKSKSFKIFDEEMNTLADIQGQGKQVVGAGSTHPNKNKYEVIKDLPIAFINYAEIQARLIPYDKKQKKEQPKKTYAKDLNLNTDFIGVCKTQIKISDVLNLIGVDTSKNPTECPFHSSKGGKCFGFENDVAHCFHCEGSWNIFSLVMQEKKCNFKEALEFLANNFGLNNELEKSRQEYSSKIPKKASKIFTLDGQAERFNEIQPTFYDKSGMFWLWNDTTKYWEISDEVDILNMIATTTGKDVITSKSRTEILNALKQKGRLNIPKPIKKTWIQFKDKIYDIKNGEQFIATSKYFVTNPIPYEVSHNPQTPVMDRIFEEWVGKDYVQTLHEIIAYSLLPDYPMNRLFCFIGAGMNGKSCFLNLLKKFVGDNNVCSTELDILLSSRFEITKLHKKLVCLMGETNFNEMNKTSILKKLTGGDTIGFEYKNKNPFQDINYAKILIATNNLPTTTDKTIGFYRRWLIVDFSNQFSEKKNILDEIPEEEYNNLATNCITILNSLLKERDFTNEGTIDERMKKFEDKSDPLEKFMKEFTIEDSDGSIWKFEFEKKLNEWCKENRFRTLSEIIIGKKMRVKGIEQIQKQADWLMDGVYKKLRAWSGIKWN